MATTPRRSPTAPPAPAGNASGQAGTESSPPRSLPPYLPGEDYVIPRQEAAYAIGYQRGLLDGQRLQLQPGGTLRGTTSPAAPGLVFSQDQSSALLAQLFTRQNVAIDRGAAWLFLTLSAVACIGIIYVAARLALWG